MKRFAIISALGLAVLFQACKKNPLPKVDEPGEPVFYSKCKVNNVPVSMMAGLDNYVMRSSYYLDDNGFYVYRSELVQKECTSGCGYEFTVLVNDSKFSEPGDAMDPLLSLAPGAYKFAYGSYAPEQYLGTFWPITQSSQGSYAWNFDDGVALTGASVTRTLTAGKKYILALNSTNGSGCSITHQNSFKAGNFLQTTISSENTQGLTYRFSATTGSKPPYKYQWNFGDNTPVSNEANPEHTYSNQAYRIVTLKLWGADGDTCVSMHQIAPLNTCEANYAFSLAPVKNTKALSMITLLMKDPSGQVYSSAENSQIANANFEILSNEGYLDMENNQRSRKIKIRFNCVVRDGTNEIAITDGEAVIAVTYK